MSSSFVHLRGQVYDEFSRALVQRFCHTASIGSIFCQRCAHLKRVFCNQLSVLLHECSVPTLLSLILNLTAGFVACMVVI